MSRAVGGSYDALGEIEKQLLIEYGLMPAHTLLDIGCGSGRLAKALVPYLKGEGRFLGTDVVAELLDYAKQGCPPNWAFLQVEEIRIPAADDSADFACFFSVFTHPLHEETFYLVSGGAPSSQVGESCFLSRIRAQLADFRIRAMELRRRFDGH
jgi:SAM-dependent methyltransferase